MLERRREKLDKSSTKVLICRFMGDTCERSCALRLKGDCVRSERRESLEGVISSEGNMENRRVNRSFTIRIFIKRDFPGT